MEKEQLNQECGWHLYEEFWVSPKTVLDPILYDYRNYKMTLEEAIFFEKNICKKTYEYI